MEVFYIQVFYVQVFISALKSRRDFQMGKNLENQLTAKSCDKKKITKTNIRINSTRKF